MYRPSVSEDLEQVLKDSAPDRWLIFPAKGILFRLEALLLRCRVELDIQHDPIKRAKLLDLEHEIRGHIRMTKQRKATSTLAAG